MKRLALLSLFAVPLCYAGQPAAAQQAYPDLAPSSQAVAPPAPAPAAPAAAPIPFEIKVEGVEGGKPIPNQFAYCVPEGRKTKNGGNVSPGLGWSTPPKGTKSLALIVVDKDVPASFENANKKGKIISQNFARQNFYHWVLIDIPVDVIGLPRGASSQGITGGGKPIGRTRYGITGQNDFAKVYGGDYGGYDGPCPPWNDERLHNYHFVIYALDLPSLGLSGKFSGQQVEDTMKGHVLGKAEAVGSFSNFPALAVRGAQ